MTDFWSFLLQTLTASGVAVLLLCVKALFRDKLSPRWQFGVWGILALILLLPAGWGGRHVLLNWPLWVEALKSALTGQFGTLTRVYAPIPLPPAAPPELNTVIITLFYCKPRLVQCQGQNSIRVTLSMAERGGGVYPVQVFYIY